MLKIRGYDLLENGKDGIRYVWGSEQFKHYIESAAFPNRSKGKNENICGYTTSVSSGCILRQLGKQCLFCRTGNNLPFGGFLTYKDIAKQNVFMVLTDMYCGDHPELAHKDREFAYMGQGEPGFSYSQVRLAIELTNTIMRELNQKVYRHVFATCGIPEAIKNYMDDLRHFYTEKVTLHFSLHATCQRSRIMPIDSIYSFRESLSLLNGVYDISGEKPCVGIMLFNQFRPKGKDFTYSNTMDEVSELLCFLDPQKCRLSFCEYNPSQELGEAAEYPQNEAHRLLTSASDMGFEVKLFSSFGRAKQAACGMLGAREPDKGVSDKWKDLEKLADQLITKYTS